jgi:hypothetical protein
LAHTFASPCLGCEPKAKVVTKNGFKYKKNITDVELIKFIKDVWPHVYQKDVITNNEINLAFAKYILA